MDADGENSVSFYVQATRMAYDATWPQPFFELAKAAFLNGKQIQVLANGEPYGDSVIFLTMS